MAPTLQILALSVAASAGLQRYANDYHFGRIATPTVFFLAQFLAYIIYAVILYPRFFSPLRHLPTPPDNHWLFGQTPRVLREASGRPMRDWVENVPNDGLIRYSMWGQERLLVTSPKALGEVLVTKNYDFVKPQQVRNGLARVLGVGILLAEGDEHKRQRKELMPAFAFRHIKDLYPVFWRKSREMVECLARASKATGASKEDTDVDSKTDGADAPHAPGALEVHNFTSRATLDIIGVSGMNHDFNSLQDPTNELYQHYRTVFNPGRVGRLLQLAGFIVPFWLLRRLPIQRNREIEDAVAYLKTLCYDLIANKRRAMQSKQGRTEVDILSVALESGGFSDEDLVNQMMTFLAAGHETTATAMIWAVYNLAKYPAVQTRLRDEIRSQLPPLTSDISAADIDNCHYLHAVCSEVLRLWSPVNLILRISDRDTSIAGHFVPKGTTIILCPWATNNSTALWGPDAHEFKPERWIDPQDGKANNKGSAESNYSFLTFLHGPRGCIGQRFAQAEFACLLAAWTGRFETRFEEGSVLAKQRESEVEIKGGITAKPKVGLWVQLRELEGW
ncbi:cytochrome P450 [Hortaea werneckii]|nr:cytochrome P450 [Hortaea werneckii]